MKISLQANWCFKCYAINAGREVRVIVKAELVNDDEAVLLATEIAKEIEEKQYPNEIKVNVIRETRAESYVIESKKSYKRQK